MHETTHGRRDFLRAAGLGSAALALAACGADSALAPQVRQAGTGPGAAGDASGAATITLDFSTDIGVLNYAYALEQLEAAFYAQAMATPYSGMSDAERRVLNDLKSHEMIHRDFFAKALGSAAIPGLTPNFSSIDFSSRASVLGTAAVLEDTGVHAYNGAARYIKSAAYLTVAGKIVSVEGRHASAIHDLLMPRGSSFAPDAFDEGFAPSRILQAAGSFIRETITVINA